jgi:hypothetical protein
VTESESRPDPESPEGRAIGHTLNELGKETIRIVAAYKHSVQQGRFDEVAAWMLRLDKALRYQQRLIQFSQKPLSELPGVEGHRRAIAGRDALVERGLMTPDQSDQTAKTVLRGTRGRKDVLRSLTARALGLKLENPQLLWKTIAGQLCPADFPIFALKFEARLTRNVEMLRALLREIESFLKNPAVTP